MARGYYEQRHSSGDGFAGFLLGALIGVTLAILYAPKSGAETRAKVTERLAGGQEKLSETLEQATACAQRRMRGIRHIVSAAFEACCAATAQSAADLRHEAGLE